MEPQSQKPLITRRTMADALADAVRERILRLDLPEGARLPQDALANEFGVSRIPVREALLQLEGEGLVRKAAHRGYMVTRVSLNSIREAFDLRALLETELLGRAIPRLREEHLDAAREVLEAFDGCLAKEAEEENWGNLNWRLHSTLYIAAERPQTMLILENVNRISDRYLRLQLKLTKRSNERARAEHRHLVELCARRDTAAATELLQAHILGARDELLTFLERRRAEESPAPEAGTAM